MLNEVTLLHVKGAVKFAIEGTNNAAAIHTENAVSYTHLEVYTVSDRANIKKAEPRPRFKDDEERAQHPVSYTHLLRWWHSTICAANAPDRWKTDYGQASCGTMHKTWFLPIRWADMW